MNRTRSGLAVTLLCSLGALLGCAAQPSGAEPEVRRLSAEDDHVRIDELRVRGQVQSLRVTPKQSNGVTLQPYEVLVAPGGRDPSGEHRDASGQRVWTVLSF